MPIIGQHKEHTKKPNLELHIEWVGYPHQQPIVSKNFFINYDAKVRRISGAKNDLNQFFHFFLKLFKQTLFTYFLCGGAAFMVTDDTFNYCSRQFRKSLNLSQQCSYSQYPVTGHLD